MGYINFSIPKEIVLKFKEKADIRNFIESGTFRGATSFWAAVHFENVYTIEIDPDISKETASKPGCPKNIEFFVGDSKDVLPELIKKISSRSLFWLDGHWCDASEIGKETECPLLDEIKALKDFESSVLLIDDARAFLGPLPPPHESSKWPRIDDIFLLLKSQFPNNLVTICDDVIFCIPPDLKDIFDEDWKRNFQKRFFPPKNSLKKISDKILNLLQPRK